MSDNIRVQSYKHLDLRCAKCEWVHIHACGKCYKKWFLIPAGTMKQFIYPVDKEDVTHMHKREKVCDICKEMFFTCQLKEYDDRFLQEDVHTELDKGLVVEVAVDGGNGVDLGDLNVTKTNAPPEKKPEEDDKDKPLQMKAEEVENCSGESLHKALKVLEDGRRGCPFKKFGCAFWGSEEDIDKHLNKCIGRMLSIWHDVGQKQQSLYERALAVFPVDCVA